MQLATIMRDRNLTAYALGKRSGLPANLIAEYARESKLPGLTNILKLCKALNCTPNQLLGIEPPQEAS